METFGLDISHHQGAGFPLARAAHEGVAFVILKATEGDGFIDRRFAENLAAARRAGLLVAAYHYQRGNVSAAAQVAHIRRVVPLDVPVIPDVEANSGTVALTRDLVARLRAAGYRVPLLYLPRWYWQQIGSPSLAGLPPLWSSRYPDNRIGSIPAEYAEVPAHYWQGYGGLPVAVLQFTSSARVAGRSPIDANAYRGSRHQLAALLGAHEEEDMPTPQDLLNYPIGRQGSRLGGRTTLGAVVANIDRAWELQAARDAAILAAVTAISKDPGITAAQLAAVVDQAVAEHTPTAEQIAAASRPAIADAVAEALGADNTDQADAIVDAIVDRLANPEGE